MKLECNNCGEEQDIFVEMVGPHLKASCTVCKKYIKFLNPEEKRKLEKEEE